METPQDRITLIEVEAERLAQYLHTCPPAAWRQPSACQGWEVRDVVAHLIDVAEFYVGTISRGMQGEETPPHVLPPTDRTAAEFIAQHAIACRERLGDQLLPTFRTQYERLSRLFAGLVPQDWDKLCYYPNPPHLRPAQAFLALSIQELAIHGWDIRSRCESAARLAVDSVAVLVQRMPQRLQNPRRAVFRLGAELLPSARYRWQETGDIPQIPDIVVAGGQCRMEPGGATAADVTFHGDAETFVLLMYQRLPLEVALATGRLVVEGNQALTAAFARWLNGI